VASSAAVQVFIDDHYRQCVEALQRIAQLADTGSDEHKKRFNPNGEGDGIANGWRVAEAMREIANDVVGNVPLCDSCDGERQVQLADEGGNRMWWPCPACRPLEQVRTLVE
jgi:hypothetical protein